MQVAPKKGMCVVAFHAKFNHTEVISGEVFDNIFYLFTHDTIWPAINLQDDDVYLYTSASQCDMTTIIGPDVIIATCLVGR